MRTIPLLLAALLLASPASAQAIGKVVGQDGKPIEGVSACIYKDGKALTCSTTDAGGNYRVEHPGYPNLLLELKGYRTTRVSAAPLTEPVVLERAAGLLVKVVDDKNNEPIAKGAVSVNLPTGKRIGSAVPFNRAGVKLGTLSPGDTMVAAEAVGYEPSGPIVVTLVGGEQKEVTIRLKKTGPR